MPNILNRFCAALFGFAALVLLSGAMSQGIGVPFGATAASCLVFAASAAALLRRLSFGRLTFVTLYPPALLFGWQATDLSSIYFEIEPMLFLCGLLLYPVGLVVLALPSSRRQFSRPAEPSTWRGFVAVVLASVGTFVFVWWWTNAGSLPNILLDGYDPIVIVVSVGVVSGAGFVALGCWVGFGASGIRTGLVWLFAIAAVMTLVHTIYYATVTVLATGRLLPTVGLASMPALFAGKLFMGIGAGVLALGLKSRRDWRRQ